MRNSFLIIVFFCLAFSGFGQKRFFGQAALTTHSKEVLSQVESQLKQDSSVLVVRIDPLNFTVLIFSNEMESMTLERFKTMFGSFSNLISCARVGEMQKDKIEAFPFRNCQ